MGSREKGTVLYNRSSSQSFFGHAVRITMLQKGIASMSEASPACTEVCGVVWERKRRCRWCWSSSPSATPLASSLPKQGSTRIGGGREGYSRRLQLSTCACRSSLPESFPTAITGQDKIAAIAAANSGALHRACIARPPPLLDFSRTTRCARRRVGTVAASVLPKAQRGTSPAATRCHVQMNPPTYLQPILFASAAAGTRQPSYTTRAPTPESLHRIGKCAPLHDLGCR